MNFIKEKREKLGLKQGDFVKEANLQISRSTYARYERENFKDLRLSDLQNIVSYFYPNLALSVLDIIEFYATNEEELLKTREEVSGEVSGEEVDVRYYENRIAELEEGEKITSKHIEFLQNTITQLENKINDLELANEKLKNAIKNVASIL